MFTLRTTRSIALSVGLAMAAGVTACNRSEDTRPVTEVQTQTAQPTNQPVTVAGCLKAGEAADTYILTTARSGGSGETATYQLVGNQAGTMKDHVGHRVEVNGTIVAEQEIASTASALPADKERATGTAGTPKVQTKTEIEIRRLSVASVKPLDDKCEM